MAASPALHRIEDAIVAGAPFAEAKAAMILVHGRGATAQSMLPLADAIGRDDIAYVAPQAAGNAWYPHPFTAPTETNEPFLSSALSLIGALLSDLETNGFPAEKVCLGGFSQGACLSTEFASRNPRRYGAIIGLSGGLIGPPGSPRARDGSLEETPVFLGCSDVDAYIPVGLVEETAEVLAALGASVDKRIYPGMGHIVNDDEIIAVQALLAKIVAA
jgi:predicted esterase